MSEQEQLKRQLLKNMFITFIVIACLFVILDFAIYNQVKIYLFKTTDAELHATIEQYKKRAEGTSTQREKNPVGPDNKINNILINPRFIYIIRNVNDEITNEESIGRFYEEYLLNVSFDNNNINNIYELTVNNNYHYRGITLKTENSKSEEIYVQLLVNVDGEIVTLKTVGNTLFIGTALITIVSILASYALSRKTLKPIIESLRKQTEFVQNTSHELRTPLTIIQAKQQLLLQEPERKIIEKSEEINLIIKETRRLTKLINELMMLATADSNKLAIKKEKTKLDDVIREIIIPYADFAKMQGKELILNLKFEKEIKIDKEKIAQVIIILLDNAIKYTKEGEKIEVKTYFKDGKCNIEVIDTGVGINKENLKHIFERFYREDKARTRETGGTGLGLSIAHTIIKLHGGTIKAQENEPKGTKITIKL